MLAQAIAHGGSSYCQPVMLNLKYRRYDSWGQCCARSSRAARGAAINFPMMQHSLWE